MNTLTKDQIQKLSPEQRGAVAALELDRAKARQRLLDQARSCRDQEIVTCMLVVCVMFPLMLLALFRSSFIGSLLLVLSISSLGLATTLRINMTNRRIDALMRLLEHDVRDSIESAKSGDEKGLTDGETGEPSVPNRGQD